MPKEIDGKTYYAADEVFKTQDEVDRIVADRLARDRQTRPEKPEDYDQIKAEHAELTKKVAGMQDEIKAAVDAARQETADAAEAQRQETAKSYGERLLEAEIRAAATAQGFRDAADVRAQIGDTTDLFGEDGALLTDALTQKVTEIAQAKPYLLAKEPTPPSAGEVGIGVGGSSAAPDVAPGADRLAAFYASNTQN